MQTYSLQTEHTDTQAYIEREHEKEREREGELEGEGKRDK